MFVYQRTGWTLWLTNISVLVLLYMLHCQWAPYTVICTDIRSHFLQVRSETSDFRTCVERFRWCFLFIFFVGCLLQCFYFRLKARFLFCSNDKLYDIVCLFLQHKLHLPFAKQDLNQASFTCELRKIDWMMTSSKVDKRCMPNCKLRDDAACCKILFSLSVLCAEWYCRATRRWFLSSCFLTSDTWRKRGWNTK